MRRGRKKRKKGYVFTMAALALCLGGMGTVYASWTDRLESRIDLGTGAFHMAVSGKTEPEAWLLDAEGETVEECGAKDCRDPAGVFAEPGEPDGSQPHGPGSSCALGHGMV